MDEKFTRDKKKPTRETEPDPGKYTHARKLRTEASVNEVMGKKLRTGKAENGEIPEETANKKKIQNSKLREMKETPSTGKKHKESTVRGAQGYATATAVGGIRNKVSEANQDDNAGADALEKGERLAEGTLYSSKAKSRGGKNDGYGKKLHGKSHDGTRVAETMDSKTAQKKLIRKEMQVKAFKEREKEAAHSFGNVAKYFVDKAEDLAGKMAEAVWEAVKSNPIVVIMVAFFAIVVMVMVNSFSTVGLIGGGTMDSSFATTYTAEDSVIQEVDRDYKRLEASVQTDINNMQTTYPGKDEYRYSCDQTGHNPYQLASLLTIIYEDYTESEVQQKLREIKDLQYETTVEEKTETRTRRVLKWHYVTRYRYEVIGGIRKLIPYQSYESYEDDEEYEYEILEVTMINHSIEYVAEQMLDADQLERYHMLCSSYGNKRELFAGDVYAVPNPGPYTDYQVPAEYLTDLEFGRMLQEAEKYLGYPYVWGGSSPATSFDCSGFVSYVINNCGNGWNVGRQTADGLFHQCAAIPPEEAKPGDLVFFQGTYSTSGASHVGIYVGDGMMIHCGNPIQYASINDTYWQNHFYTFGRLNH